jgi:hypothetical protein
VENKLKENIRNAKISLKRTVHQLNVAKSPSGFVFVFGSRVEGERTENYSGLEN